MRTTCSYCGVGCNFDLNVRNGKIVRVTSASDAPVNGMALCVKGRYGYDYVHHPDRLTRPLVRTKWLDPGQVAEKLASGEWLTRAICRPGAEEAAAQRIAFCRRARFPAIRVAAEYVEVDWDTALDVVARKFAAQVKAESGGDAFAVLTSAKCTNEENYLVNKLTRQVLGTNSIDHCARL